MLPGGALNIVSRRRTSRAAFGDTRRVLQACDFLQCEMTELPRFDVEFERSIANAPDLLHVMSDLFEHAADLTIASFGQCDLIPRVGRVAHQFDSRRSGVDGFRPSHRGTTGLLWRCGLQPPDFGWQKDSGPQSSYLGVRRSAA